MLVTIIMFLTIVFNAYLKHNGINSPYMDNLWAVFSWVWYILCGLTFISFISSDLKHQQKSQKEMILKLEAMSPPRRFLSDFFIWITPIEALLIFVIIGDTSTGVAFSLASIFVWLIKDKATKKYEKPTEV